MKKSVDGAGELSSRNREIFYNLVNLYISRAEPVGSRTIAETCIKELSSATIRHCLEEMEQLGYLYKPHTSAGRAPTEKGFKYYVSGLLESGDDKNKEIEFLKSRFEDIKPDYRELFKLAALRLSELTRQTAVALLPRLDNSFIKTIDFIKLSSSRILVVVVFKLGLVENKIIEVERNYPQDMLSGYARYVNNLLEKSMSLAGIREKMLHEMKNLKILFDTMLDDLNKKPAEKEVLVEGQSYLFDTPEFSDMKDMKKIFKAFEEKGKIVELLDKSIKTEGVKIYMGGSELSGELDGVAVVAASYGGADGKMGTLGIIGPMRMDYPRIIPLVSSTAKLLSYVLCTSRERR